MRGYFKCRRKYSVSHKLKGERPATMNWNQTMIVKKFFPKAGVAEEDASHDDDIAFSYRAAF